MRKTFASFVTSKAVENKDVWLLTGDMGYNLFNDFPKERFINCGVAEQNMIGVAAGLALSGKKVYCYSISTFLVFRPFEFIRNDVCYQNLDVKLVGCCGPYDNYGESHNCGNEDVIALAGLPNITIFEPSRVEYVLGHLEMAYSMNTPCYIKLKR